jgi:hypothetical protein
MTFAEVFSTAYATGEKVPNPGGYAACCIHRKGKCYRLMS